MPGRQMKLEKRMQHGVELGSKPALGTAVERLLRLLTEALSSRATQSSVGADTVPAARRSANAHAARQAQKEVK